MFSSFENVDCVFECNDGQLVDMPTSKESYVQFEMYLATSLADTLKIAKGKKCAQFGSKLLHQIDELLRCQNDVQQF